MTLSIRADKPTAEAHAGANITINTPSGAAVNDILVAFVCYADVGPGSVVTDDSGQWTNIVNQGYSTVTSMVVSIWYRTLSSTPPSSYTFMNNYNDGVGCIMCITGTDPAFSNGQTEEDTAGPTLTSSSFTPSQASTLILSVFSMNQNGTTASFAPTSPAGSGNALTEIIDLFESTNMLTMWIGSETQSGSATATTHEITYSGDGTSNRNAGIGHAAFYDAGGGSSYESFRVARKMVAKAATASKVTATLDVASAGTLLAGKSATSSSSKATLTTTRSFAAKSATTDGANATRVGRTRALVTKSATSSSAKASLGTTRTLAAKSNTATETHDAALSRTRGLSAKGPTAASLALGSPAVDQVDLPQGSYIDGKWVTFPISVTAGNDVTITVDHTHAGNNVLVSGVFLDTLGAHTPGVAVESPQGNWVGEYGSSGGVIRYGGSNLTVGTPPFTFVVTTGQSFGGWGASSGDTRSLTDGDNGDTTRDPSCWFNGYPTPLVLTLSFTSDFTGDLSIYSLDWDSYGPRSQLIAVDHVLSGEGFRVARALITDVQAANDGTASATVARDLAGTGDIASSAEALAGALRILSAKLDTADSAYGTNLNKSKILLALSQISASATGTLKSTRPIVAKVGAATSAKARLDTNRADVAAQISTSIKAKASLATGRTLSATLDTATSATAPAIARSRAMVAKSATATQATGGLSVARPIVAKVGTATSVAPSLRTTRTVSGKSNTASGTTSAAQVARKLGTKPSLASSAKASTPIQRALSAKAGTSSSVTASMTRTQPNTWASDLATAASAKASLVKTESMAAKVGTATSAAASMGVSKSLTTKPSTATSATAPRINRVRSALVKLATVISAKAASFNRSARVSTSLATATSATADLHAQPPVTELAAQAATSSSASATMTCTRPMDGKSAQAHSARAHVIRSMNVQATVGSTSHAIATPGCTRPAATTLPVASSAQARLHVQVKDLQLVTTVEGSTSLVVVEAVGPVATDDGGIVYVEPSFNPGMTEV